MEIKRIELPAESMGYGPEEISAVMELDEEHCIPTSEYGANGIRFVKEKGVTTEVLADIVPLCSGHALIWVRPDCMKNTDLMLRINMELETMRFMSGAHSSFLC